MKIQLGRLREDVIDTRFGRHARIGEERAQARVLVKAGVDEDAHGGQPYNRPVVGEAEGEADLHGLAAMLEQRVVAEVRHEVPELGAQVVAREVALRPALPLGQRALLLTTDDHTVPQRIMVRRRRQSAG
ncbi:hypothetical protein [Sorangium sp. So ce693]|uniref:hypothetical protein n=1 Tax=Sorangium sp. So ce693 TaxID=3133318 RepID=UPI003F634D04